ncbi:MAG: hypothetical protein PHP37_00480 [Patescibacteria group bacterium]|nr:hypothetical protein [Patescibacteria group bacterium]
MRSIRNNKLVVFLTIDGWGVSSFIENNAIRKAEILGFKNLVANYPATIINTPLNDSDFKLSQAYRLLGLGKKNISQDVSNLSLSKIISRANLRQLKIASSYDLPLLSVFFNNSSERFLNESWVVCDKRSSGIWSFFNKGSLVDELIKNIKSDRYNFIFSSLSDISREFLQGDFSATVLAVEETSYNLDKIARTVLSVDGTLIISGVYGGAEDVYNLGTGIANKKRSTNPVPFMIIGNKYQGRVIGSGEAPNNDLSLLSPAGTYLDVAPTILNILNLNIPIEMEGKSLII